MPYLSSRYHVEPLLNYSPAELTDWLNQYCENHHCHLISTQANYLIFEADTLPEPVAKWPEEWPVSTSDVERLRMNLIRYAVLFMDRISDGSLVEFTAIERRNIISYCHASEQELRDLAAMYDLYATA